MNKCDKKPDITENYGFKSKNYLGQCNEFQNFENDLFNIAKFVKFRNIKDKFQQMMKEDVDKVQLSTNVLVLADKDTNTTKCHQSNAKNYS